MNSELKCIPNYESLFTINFNNISEYSKYIYCTEEKEFLLKEEFNKNISKIFYEKCLKDCHDKLYLLDTQIIQPNTTELETEQIFSVSFSNKYYQVINYLVTMSMMQLVISMANIVDAW